MDPANWTTADSNPGGGDHSPARGTWSLRHRSSSARGNCGRPGGRVGRGWAQLQRPWNHADMLVAGTPEIPFARATELVVAPPLSR